MISATARLENPPAQRVTISVTMTVAEWGQIADVLREAGWPSWKVGGLIRDALYAITKQVSEETDTLK